MDNKSIEERALELYPVEQVQEFDQYGIGEYVDINESKRAAYIIGRREINNTNPIVDDSAIAHIINPMFGGLEAASIQHFLETGKLSGSFLQRLQKVYKAGQQTQSAPAALPTQQELLDWMLVNISTRCTEKTAGKLIDFLASRSYATTG